MIERPILLNAQEVQAILDGRKNQHREVIKLPSEYADWRIADDEMPIRDGVTCVDFINPSAPTWAVREEYTAKSPYGKRGDWLWVRETWATDKRFDCVSPANIGPDLGYVINLWWLADGETSILESSAEQGRTRQSIHMPRWANRLTMKVNVIRAERLQVINEYAAENEGIERISPTLWKLYDGTPGGTSSAVESFRTLWDLRNAKRGYSFDSDPWVWMVGWGVG